MRASRAVWFVILSSLVTLGCALSTSSEQISPDTGSVQTPADRAAQAPAAQSQPDASPKTDSIRFAVIGDNGNGGQEQLDVAGQMEKYRQTFPFDFVLMLGDNLYGGNSPRDYAKKFERPYKTLLDAGVKFYASLGNHDNSNERFYDPFNMGGQRYYTFKKGNVAFFALDSNYMDPPQLAWLEEKLKTSDAAWKLCYFHHPLYSDGKFHGPDPDLRVRIEPLFMKYGVNLVLSGHEHVYERIQPQHGIYYFVEGSSGELRLHNLRPSSQMVKGFDTDRAFILAEIAGNEFRFRTISRSGQVIDSGTLLNH
jgi:3',5'-cyclic AMP phosphodiesterase CpdA